MSPEDRRLGSMKGLFDVSSGFTAQDPALERRSSSTGRSVNSRMLLGL